ncbi:hypothetical protein FRC11_000564 [Ceratobasidium sp. 423]|nr:hypothetical protein FRC11_000564 [Ceratobasidium sp. 423]
MAQRFEDLATEYLSDGLPVDAVNCLVHYSRTSSAIQRSRNIISVFLWANFGLSDAPRGKASDQANLLVKICNSRDDLLDSEGLQDVKIFQAILSEDRLSLDRFYSLIGNLNQKSEGYSPRVVILQHHVLKGNDWVSCSSHNTFPAYLEIWSAYNDRLQQFKTLKTPSQDMNVRRLFGLSSPSTVGTSEVIIPNGSPLHEVINKSHGSRPKGKNMQLGITIPTGTADMYIRTTFTNCVKRELVTLSSDLLRSHRAQLALFSPTGVQTTRGSSFEDAIKSILHVLPTLGSAMDREYDSSTGAFTQGDEAKIRVAWSTRIFSVLYSPSGIVGELDKALLSIDGGHSGPGAARIYAWISKMLESLDSLEHTFATLLIVCVALISELLSNEGSLLTVPPLKFKKHPRSSIPRGSPREPDRFTDDIVTFFQRDSPWRIVNMNRILQRMVRQSWFVDISVLTQLIEQTTREVIVAERAAISWQFGGFSGLIVPRSWAINLIKHSAHAEHAYTLKPESLVDFVSCMKEVLVRISNGIPDHWNTLATRDGGRWGHPGHFAPRLLWSIMLVMVNLHPSHESAPFVLNALNQVVARIFSHRDSFAEGAEPLGFSISRLPRTITQQSCLGTLLQTYPHEDVVMLQARKANVRPDAWLLNGKIIKFDTLADLHSTFARHLQPYPKTQVVELNSKPVPATELHEVEPELNEITADAVPPISQEDAGFEPSQVEPTRAMAVVPPPRPDTPASVADSDKSLDEWDNEPSITPEEAALRLFGVWRRSVKRAEQRQRLSDFDQAGQLYGQYHQHFPKIGAKTPERDKLGLKLIRGPGINIVLGLRLLVEEVDAYVEALDEEIKAPGLTPGQLARTQESIKERKKKAE